MMFSRLLNRIDRIQLNKIATSLSKSKENLQAEQAKLDGYAVLFEPYSRPVCGMERRGNYAIEKAGLESKMQACTHDISRDEVAYTALLARKQMLERRIQRRTSAQRSAGFSLHPSH